MGVQMASNQVEQYRRWFQYEKDAHARVVRSLESVPVERRTGREFRRAVTLFAHMAAARRVWLCRLGFLSDMPASIFPEDVELATAAKEMQAIQEHWDAYLARLTDEELARSFEYKSLDAGRFRNRVEDILAQLFGHSSYHRGQIAMLVRAAGGEPAVTDLIYWCREPSSPAG
jgi:uncharacterized damage-inducible protein DinB